MKFGALVLLSVCFVSCASTGHDAISRAAREGLLPSAFPSYDAAVAYSNALFAGGRVDRVQLGTTSYLVVIQHGSGRPVLGIAVYEKKSTRWERVPTNRTPVFDFVRASNEAGKIILTEERSRQVWTLYDTQAKG